MSRATAQTFQYTVVVCALTLTGCRCEPEARARLDAGDPQRTAAEQRCAPAGAHGFVIRSTSNGPPSDSQAVALPFAVQTGSVVPLEEGFVLSYLRGSDDELEAGLVLLDEGVSRGNLVSLGRVHGDASPPRLARLGATLGFALPDGDANGGHYRLGTVALVAGSSSPTAGEVKWLASLDQGNDKSPAFDLAAGHGQFVFAYDDWSRKKNLGMIRIAVLAEGTTSAVKVASVSLPEVDAESPRLAVRPSGYWLAYVALGEPEPASGDDLEPLRVSRRWLELVPLNLAGQAAGEPLAVTSKAGYVRGYDLVAGHDGSVLLTWRAERAAPGITGGRVSIARVAPDGSVENKLVEDQNVGIGVPSFVFDSRPQGGRPHAWLSVAAANGLTQIAALSPWGAQLEQLETDQTLGSGGVLAARGGQILLARASGRDVAISLVRCGDGTPLAP